MKMMKFVESCINMRDRERQNNKKLFIYKRIGNHIFMCFRETGIWTIKPSHFMEGCVGFVQNGREKLAFLPTIYPICAPVPHIESLLLCLKIKKIKVPKNILILIIVGFPYASVRF
jgi:hypothetical protein